MMSTDQAEMGGGYMPPQQDREIAGMRWKGDDFVVEMYKILGGKIAIETEEGIRWVKRNPHVKSVMNDEGIESIIQLLQGIANPMVVLSNLTEERAQSLIKQTLDDLAAQLMLCQKEYDLSDSGARWVYATLKPVIVGQISRPINGFEAKNFRTQTVEQNTKGYQEIKEGNSWFSRRQER